MINNRQAGRRRGRGGGNNNSNGGGGGGGGPRQGGQGNGSRIDNRARGNATQLHEKYKNMAADAQRAGDRVNTEYYLQFADHYFRVLSEQRGRFEDQQQPRRGRDEFDEDGDGEFSGGGEFGDEGEPIRANDQSGERGNDRDGEQGRDDRGPREDRFRDGNGDGRPREDRQDRQRVERPREERARDDRPRAERDGNRDAGRDGGQRDVRRDGNGDGGNRPRNDGEWQDREPRRERQPQPVAARPMQERPVEVAGQRRADPVGPTESLEHRAEDVLEADRPLEAPARRRGRPRRDAVQVATASETVASEDAGSENAGIAADRLPPSLSASLTVAANDEAPEAKPRRRRARPAEDTPTAAE
ncbi:DUF4167 domain-containing protein [Sphingomonas sp.]|uniref:DUF4167 domain-containing protein n=1 Tax=Sphingomonas sp. TaxID=28214 RepID=UPI003B00AEB3